MPKFPKKVREIFFQIRRGEVKKGLAALETIDGFELEKNIVRAEVAYFELDWKKGLDLTKTYLAHPEAYYYVNIFQEHIALLLRATSELKCWSESEKYLKGVLKFYADAIKGVKDKSVFTFQVKMILSQMKKRKSVTEHEEEEIVHVRKKGTSLDDLIAQQEEYRPKLSAKGKEVERAGYLLNFLATDGTSKDYLSVYEKFADHLDYEDHKHAAMEYAAAGKKSQAQGAILRCAAHWWPIEAHQVEPVELLANPTLIPFLDRKICAKILKTPKGPDKV